MAFGLFGPEPPALGTEARLVVNGQVVDSDTVVDVAGRVQVVADLGALGAVGLWIGR